MKKEQKNNQEAGEALLRMERTTLSESLAVRQLRVLAILGVLFIALVVNFYIAAVTNPYEDIAETAVVNVESGRLTLLKGFSEVPAVRYEIRQKNGDLYYTNVFYELHPLFGFIPQISIMPGDKEHWLVVRRSFDMIIENQECVAYAYISLSGEGKNIVWMAVSCAIAYLLLMLAFYFKTRKIAADVLSPLKKMSAILERLSVNNLHSERLDIMGANNEIKDLAIVCNEMLDRLETSYESQKQFVSNASHELRTPIAVMQGYANLLNRWGASDPAILAEAVDALCNVSKEMQELVEKLLFLSRHDRRTLKLKKDWFDMKEVVEELFRETEMVVTDRKLECTAAETVMIYGDKQIMKQGMRVFIDNAVKYTESGDTIRIACRNVRDDCELVVEDTGIGMKRRDLERIFSRFYRADDVRDRNISGHGLGLSIAKLIIMSHCGRIHIRTQYTKGTSFTIYIPRRR